MKSQLQVTFRNMQPAANIEEWIKTAAAKLETLYGRLMACRVIVEVPHRHRNRGSTYHLRIDLKVPQGEIVVKRECNLAADMRHLGESEITKQRDINALHKALRTVINDAFKAAGRRLQDCARRQRRNVKQSAGLSEGRVSKLLPREGFGFLTSTDGREIYFHKNSVLGRAFPRLKIGMRIRYAEENGEKGPQASTVHVASTRRIQQTSKRATA